MSNNNNIESKKCQIILATNNILLKKDTIEKDMRYTKHSNRKPDTHKINTKDIKMQRQKKKRKEVNKRVSISFK